MTDLIQRICDAVIRQEGESPESTNPANLRSAPWLPPPLVLHNGFWFPATRAQGVAGLAHLVALHMAQGNSLRDFIAGHPGVYAGFAPAADHNDPETYIAHVAKWAAIPDPDVPLLDYLLEEAT